MEYNFELNPATQEELDSLKEKVSHDVQRCIKRQKEIPLWLRTVMWLVEAYELEVDGEGARNDEMAAQMLGPYKYVTVTTGLDLGGGRNKAMGILIEDYNRETGIVIGGPGQNLRIPSEHIMAVQYWEVAPNEKTDDAEES